MAFSSPTETRNLATSASAHPVRFFGLYVLLSLPTLSSQTIIYSASFFPMFTSHSPSRSANRVEAARQVWPLQPARSR
jgi:hypothetical protein